MMHKEELLAGKLVLKAWVKDNSVWLECKDEKPVHICAKGDCCSEAFIDAVEVGGFPTLDGKSIEMEFEVQPTVQECDMLYAVKFTGQNGYVAILHRNSSNGYYGSYLSVDCHTEIPDDAELASSWYRMVES